MKARNKSWADYMAYLTFASLPFRDLRFISFLSLQDLFLSILFVFVLAKNSKPKINLGYLVGAGFYCLILLLQSSIVSKDIAANNAAVAKVIISYFLLPLVLYLYCDNSDKIILLCYSFIAGNSLANILILFGLQNIDSNGRESGFSGHPIFAGIANGLAIALMLALYKSTRIWYLSAIAIFPLAIYGLTLAISSTAYIVLIIGISIVGLYRETSRNIISRFFTLALMIFSLITIVLYTDFFSSARNRFFESLNPAHSFTLITGDNSTLLARIYSIRYSWTKIKDHLVIGNGFEPDARITQIGLEPHNIFFMAWQTGGLIFLALIVFLSYLSIYKTYQNFKTSNAISTVLLVTTWIALLTGPALYDRSILAPLFLGLISSIPKYGFKR